ncbi:class 1 isoprenoid biosynthesis enzyme [Myxococcus qinghaiensis]|uniref:class 1 isoprenoid biosynthesis enzyme n=1 Tax=Myxococcus qinghaiensis TaxID=2906758 RepID=UPI0020A77D75|nr:prenyltransferase/squalene oxidase repeat-containing protein [Myxococcus qinghaiensis]MCP3166852.1 hypothetical protein [Myxococcus qinghaiensis]
MTATILPPFLLQQTEAAAATVAELGECWPEALGMGSGRRSSYFDLPYLFQPAFRTLEPEPLRAMGAFVRLMASAIFLHDELADGDVPQSLVGQRTLRLMALQFEAFHLLQHHIPAAAPFWGRLRGYLVEHATASLDEQRFSTRERPWSEYTEDVALAIVRGKNGMARVVAAGLVALAGDEHLLDPLEKTIDAFNVASQMCDDLMDWREDLRRGIPSLFLCRVVHERPRPAEPAELERQLQRVARELYYRGHASYVIRTALEALEVADRFREHVPDVQLPWYALTDALRRQCLKLQQDIQRITDANVRRSLEQPELTLELPEPDGPWQGLAWDVLRFLLRQWQLGFGELRASVQGQSGGDASMDTSTRALVLEALCEADAHLGGALQGLLAREALLLRDQLGLLPDPLSRARLRRALTRAGDGAWVETHGPTRDETRPTGERDDEVLAELLYTQWLKAPARCTESLQGGADWLEARQLADGAWEGRWNLGPYACIHACLRLLTRTRPGSPAIRRALGFVRRHQQADGGWGVGAHASDPLSTALALLCLATAREQGGEAEDLDRAARARAYLKTAHEPDGAWRAQPLLRAAPGTERYLGSRTLTSALVLTATLEWHRRAALTADSADLEPSTS